KVQFELTTTRVITKSIHPYILIASSPAIPDGQPWRDGASRDLRPRNALLSSDVDVVGP
ncbi:hypothetical protein COCVIDRAFT_98104, partial [Bipolaris victoriae FI3]